MKPVELDSISPRRPTISEGLRQSAVLAWKAGRWFVLAIILILGVSSLIPVASLWITKELVNTVTLLSSNPRGVFPTAIRLLILQLAISILGSLLRAGTTVMETKLQDRLSFYLQDLVSTKVNSLSYQQLERPEIFDQIQRVKNGLSSRVLGPLRETLQAGQAILVLTSFMGFLAASHWVLAALTLGTALPSVWAQFRFGQHRYGLAFLQTPMARRAWYLSELLCDRQAAKEIRAFGIGRRLIDLWKSVFLAMSSEKIKLVTKQSVWSAILESTGLVAYTISLLFVLNFVRLGSITLGDFVALAQAIQSTQGTLLGLAQNLGRIYENGLFLTDLTVFLGLPEEPKAGDGAMILPSLKSGIEVSALTYSYPGTNTHALLDVSFRIGKGEKIAVVGENGAGKTTLVKCLLGLYPYKGKILLDGGDLHYIGPQSLRRRITVLFQDFLKYQFTLRENIGLGNVNNEWEDKAIGLAARNAGVDQFVDSLPEGYETVLGRLFSGGQDLSEGQWQRVALARAFFRDSEVFILDEPTASLDPRAEIELFERFTDLSRGKTGIFISHRLGTTRLADRILVLKGGRLVEEGTFSDLLARGGYFAELYRVQAHWYQDSIDRIVPSQKNLQDLTRTSA